MADAALAYDEGRWTYRDYKDWELKPGERFELIYGVAYAMSAPNTEHQQISMYLSAKLFNHLEGKTCRPLAAPYDVRLFYEEDETDDTVVQPDLIVVSDPEKLGPEGCRGAPDLLIEILSPSNIAEEMSKKLKLYLKAGVPEYWLISPEEKLISVYRLVDGRYAANVLQIGDILGPVKFPDLEIPLKALFE